MHSFFQPKESTYFKGIVNPGDSENKCLLPDHCHLMVHSFVSTFVCILTLEPFLYHTISDPHFIARGGGHLDPYYLINAWLYKHQILQAIRDTLQGLIKYKVCKKSFLWLPW